MGKVGGQRNFGYGKQMAWAGRSALADRYGHGHYATVAAHAERWRHFVAYAREAGITDAGQVDRALVEQYGRRIAEEVRQGDIRVAYAQNLLSTVNVVLQTLRAAGGQGPRSGGPSLPMNWGMAGWTWWQPIYRAK